MWNNVCDRCESILFLLHPFEHRAIAYRTLYRGTFVRCDDSRTWNVSSWNCTIWTAWSTCHIFWTRLVKQNYITNEFDLLFPSININEWMGKNGLDKVIVKFATPYILSQTQHCNTTLRCCTFHDNLFKSILLFSVIPMQMTFLNQTKQINLKRAPNKSKIHKFTLPVPSHSHLIKTRARKWNSYQ